MQILLLSLFIIATLTFIITFFLCLKRGLQSKRLSVRAFKVMTFISFITLSLFTLAAYLFFEILPKFKID